MTLEQGELITARDEPHAQIRHQPRRTTDNYPYALYVRYPHTPPKHILNQHFPTIADSLSGDDEPKFFRLGWVYHSGHPDEDQARQQMQNLTEDDAAEHYELMIADILINKGFQHNN
jgi:hypothetical protein